MPRNKENAKISARRTGESSRNVRFDWSTTLIEYVRGGGGLVGIHAARIPAIDHQEYGKTIGGYFNGHPWGSKNKVTIVVEDPDHGINEPVFGDQKDFTLVEEMYPVQGRALLP
jgi:type 1 glutamine amidotransferase